MSRRSARLASAGDRGDVVRDPIAESIALHGDDLPSLGPFSGSAALDDVVDLVVGGRVRKVVV